MADPTTLNDLANFPTSYGSVGMTRRGRVPIEFTDKGMPDTDSGEYHPFTSVPTLPLARYMMNPGNKLQDLIKGLITINPKYNGTDTDIPNTIRHEDVHAMLNQTGNLYSSPQFKGYKGIARQIAQTRGGDMDAETAAYMTAFEPNSTPVDPTKRAAFVDDMLAKLGKQNPAIAKKLGNIAYPGDPRYKLLP